MEAANKIAESYQKDTKIDITKIPQLTIDNQKHVYDYKDITLTSKYKVIVIYDDREIRVPIDFSIVK